MADQEDRRVGRAEAEAPSRVGRESDLLPGAAGPGRGAGLEGEGEVGRLKAALEAVVASLPPDIAPDLALMRQVQRSEARYKALVTLSSNMVWVRDAQLRFSEPCPAWERFTGQTFEEYRGHGWLEAIHPEDRVVAREKLLSALENFEPMVRLRYRLRHVSEHGDFEWRHVEVTASPVQDGSGQIVEWVGMVRDRTEQHEWEDQKLRKTEELARSNRDLEDFAYIAAHDLKEPLRGIRLIASFLEEDSRGKLDEDGRRRISQLHELCGRMQLLLDSLLESAKVASAPLNPGWVEVAAVAMEALQMVSARVQECGARVSVQPTAQGVKVWADEARLAQVISNLISNGIKYNEAAEKTVEIGVAPPAPGQSPGFLTIYVRDNGIGVAPEQIGSVFRMFRRLHPRELYGGGAGAGLAIVKKIVERHGGRVWLESSGAGQGSTVYLSIPAVEQGPPDRVSSSGQSMET